MGALVFLLAMAAIGAGAVLAWYAKQRRRDGLARFALQYGLEYSRVDPFGLIDTGFRLFRLGDGRGVENVLSGSFSGLPLTEADYWYYDETSDAKGGHARSYRYFSVVLVDLPAWLPDVIIERENLLTEIAGALSFHDLQFESEDFNRRFHVRAADQAFAFKLVDARMIRWLLSMGGQFGFEVSGPRMLVWCRRRNPADLVPLLGSAKLFRDHIPRLVWNEYGEGPPGPADPVEEGRSAW